MQELEPHNTNRDISLLKKFQRFLKNICWHWIKTNSSPALLLEGLHFRETNNTCQSKMFLCSQKEFPGKRESRNLGFLHHNKLNFARCLIQLYYQGNQDMQTFSWDNSVVLHWALKSGLMPANINLKIWPSGDTLLEATYSHDAGSPGH